MKYVKSNYYLIITLFLLCVEITIALLCKSGFVRHTFGDYLASILIYCFLKSFIKAKPWILALITLIISFSIEALQYLNILKTLNLENNILIKTILGSAFCYQDLLAYTLGVTTIYFIDLKTYHYAKPKN